MKRPLFALQLFLLLIGYPCVMNSSAASIRERASAVDRRPPANGRPQGLSAIGPWQLTACLSLNRRTVVARSRAPAERWGPGCYAVKAAASGGAGCRLGAALLKREAAVAAEVVHPHLIAVLATSLEHAPPYIVLPYLEGATLAQLLAMRRRSLTPQRALWIARQTAEAVAALHRAGWLHGQVRPEHIIVSPQGHATLVDLSGCRRLRSAECASAPKALVAPRYAAPEIFSHAGRWTEAADIYALGISLFEALAGQPPFLDSDPQRLAAAHRRLAVPDVRQRCPAVSLEVGQLLFRLLAKEPLRRPTAQELLQWLAELEIAELA